MKYAIITFGCKVSQYESSVIDNAMKAAGYEPCNDGDKPDIVIVNSCTVTENSDSKAKRAVRRAHASGAVTVLTGCYPQAFREEAAQCGADIVTGTARRVEIPALIGKFLAGCPAVPDLTLPSEYEETGNTATADKTRSFIKVEDGCDRYCSYCAIPFARGAVRSRKPESIAEEAALCAGAGHRELVLAGINLSRYGSDIGLGLADAVKAASTPQSIVRVRLSSLEPELLDERTAAALAECEKLCPHFHLSLQSGCDSTLRRMNRHYDTEEYSAIVSRLRSNFPNCAITTDVIVGFPGETEEEFRESLRFVENAGFARVHVFTYSKRPGTAAARMPGQLPDEVKVRRHAEMSGAAARIYRDFLVSHTGRTEFILVQKRTSPEYAEGLTPDYAPVRVYGSRAERHDIIKVYVIGTGEKFCIGEEIL
ncbi:MAG: tRNA (N(6)-L-threonylcarbamoyladenosine(37)-C(2))-methylthiotransferase MtaB [Ruminiclostridium sp.]|nr:tRNA (N(6)-L-threonylcarbamoyladenosine(37)-C(2))-methylthiotransferase MtaB [Ruminiclostridium sp.]